MLDVQRVEVAIHHLEAIHTIEQSADSVITMLERVNAGAGLIEQHRTAQALAYHDRLMAAYGRIAERLPESPERRLSALLEAARDHYHSFDPAKARILSGMIDRVEAIRNAGIRMLDKSRRISTLATIAIRH